MKRVNYMSAGLIAMTLAGVMLPITSVFAADGTNQENLCW